jgi:hypothetical protein
MPQRHKDTKGNRKSKIVNLRGAISPAGGGRGWNLGIFFSTDSESLRDILWPGLFLVSTDIKSLRDLFLLVPGPQSLVPFLQVLRNIGYNSLHQPFP